MKEFKYSQILRPGLLFYFLTPYFIFLYFFKFSLSIEPNDLLWALKNSFFQSTVAAFITIALSIPMSHGLLKLSDKAQTWVSRLLVIPQILPALFSILIALSIVNPFPMGSAGVIILFVMINLGFATLLNYTALKENIGMLAVISEVYSIGRFVFLKKIYFPLMKKELLTNFFMIFIFCMSSFSIPLIVGGGKGTNLEVLIFEKIFVEQKWSLALSLCAVQVSLIFVLSALFLKKPEYKEIAAEFNAGSYIQSNSGLILIAVYLFLYLGGYLSGLVQSVGAVDFLLQYKSELFDVTLFTFKALLAYLFLNILLLVLWLLDYLKFHRFNPAINLLSASTVLVGFSFYLFFPLTQNYDIVKIIVATSILFFPVMFKLLLQKPIENLNQQLIVSQVFGLKKSTIISEIIFRQIGRPLFLWVSLLIVWFASEYALLKALGVQSQTLGLFAEGFLSSYRLPVSYLLSFYILVFWLFSVFTVYYITKVAYVVYKKFNT